MNSFRTVCVCLGLASLPLLAAPQAVMRPAYAAVQAAPPAADRGAFLATYCVSCHGRATPAAGLAFDRLDAAALAGHEEVWEKAVLKVRSGDMPPAGARAPDTAARTAFVASLASSLDQLAAAHPNPGRAVAHRLNRTEYANAVRDLLGVEIDSRDLLPADDAGYGFDNIADVLSVSPSLLDRYMSAAGKISRIAVGDPTLRTAVKIYAANREMVQNDRMSEELPFGTRGGLAVRHYFPVDGEYLIKLRMMRTANDSIIGVNRPNTIELRVDRKQLRTFSVGGDGPINPWAVVSNPSLYEQTADDVLEVRLSLKAGVHAIGSAFLTGAGVPEEPMEPRLSTSTYAWAMHREGEASLSTIEVRGPLRSEGAAPESAQGSNPKVFVCRPAAAAAEEACARRIVSSLARHAFRRPATEQDVRTLMGFYQTGRAKGSFESGIELAVRSLLVDPDFMFRVERDPSSLAPGTLYRVSDLDLASRLSFFLWSSIPDDQLLDLAAANRLHEPAVLDAQVRLMLGDERSRALITNFAGQWLYVRNIQGVAPDPEGFPEFDENLREAFRQETQLFMESQLREDRGVADLLTANYTFLNERLARHYGIPGIYGSTFRRTTLSDPNRMGLLGHGSVLTVTSYAHRTAPTLRGKWIMQNLLGAPPPPPPPNIPALEAASAPGRTATVRELLEEHRKNPTCASCHARMDQYGFALENFDAIGRWRTVDQTGTTIDSSAALPDGSRFEGIAGLREYLLRDKSQFAGALTERLMTYALGRGVEYYDQPALRRILRDAQTVDYRWSSLIAGIVGSTPFQMRRTEQP
jgi:mono/diheme cytochrome c family protein